MSAEHCGMSTGCLESQRQVWKPRSLCKRSEQVRDRIGTHTGEDWRVWGEEGNINTEVAIHPLSFGALITSSVLLTTHKLDTTFSSLQMKPTFQESSGACLQSEVPGVRVGTWPQMHWTSKLNLIPLLHWPKYAERPSVDWQPCGLAHSWPGGLPNCSLMAIPCVDVRTDAYTFHGAAGKYVKQKGKDINLIICHYHRYVKYSLMLLNEGWEEIQHNACIFAIWNVSPIFTKISITCFSFLHNFQKKSHNLEMHLRNPWAQNSH